MNDEKIFKEIYRAAILRYYLSRNEECVVARTFINVGNGKLLYSDFNGNRLLFEKENLYSKLQSLGFEIKDYDFSDDSTTVSYFLINKKVIKEKIKEEKTKKKGLK